MSNGENRYMLFKFGHVVFGIDLKLLFSGFQAYAVTLSGLASGERWGVLNPANNSAGPTPLEKRSFLSVLGKESPLRYDVVGLWGHKSSS
jgi:hypothetical protein